jgi:hypothetical protein
VCSGGKLKIKLKRNQQIEKKSGVLVLHGIRFVLVAVFV